MTAKVRKIYNMADEAMTLEDFKKKFVMQNGISACLAVTIAEKTIAARKLLDGYGYYTCVLNNKKIFVGE